MGGYITRHSEDEVMAEKDKFLNMSVDSRRHHYVGDEYTPLSSVKPWQRYYDENIPVRERDVVTDFRIDDTINQKVSLYRGDITRLELDAVVNSAAKPGRGQVNLAIMKRAGDFYKEECLLRGLRAPGEALVTGGYKLPAKYVINVLAPYKKERNHLRNCYSNTLNAAKQNGFRTVAFPCIATRKRNRFPRSEAATIALDTVRTWMETNKDCIDRVIFCVYTIDDLRVYKKTMQEYFPVLSRNREGYSSPPDDIKDDMVEETESSFVLELTSSSDESKIQSGCKCKSHLLKNSAPGTSMYKVGNRYDSSMGAAAPKNKEAAEDLEFWRKKTSKHTDNQIISIDRMDKKKLFKSLFKMYHEAGRPGNEDLTNPPSIQYKGEEAIDLGGLSREYFVQTLETLTNTIFEGSPSFEGPEDHKLPTASRIQLERGVFDVIGKAIAHSILHGGIGFIGLSPAIVFLLTHPILRDDVEQSGIPICLDDVPQFDLKDILEMKNANCLLEDHKRTLTDYMDNYNVGYMKIEDSTIPYIKQELMMYEVVTRRWSQIEALRRGMDSVKMDIPGQEYLGLYTFLCQNASPENIKEVFPNTADIRVDPQLLLAKVKLQGKAGQTWSFFKDFLREVHEGKVGDATLNDVISFWTGHPLLPNEHLKVEIQHTTGLPEAMTCFSTLTLPGGHIQYVDFREAFQTALKHGARGFDET